MMKQNEFYTKKEVSALLGVAESTVYSLAKANKIEAEKLPKGVSRPKRYTKESVHTYKQNKQKQPDGLGIHELANKYQVSKQRMYQVIKKLKIETSSGVVGKRKILLVAQSDEQLIATELNKKTHKGTKTDFYRHQEDIALFQLFISSSKERYRLTRNAYNEWGIYLPITNEFILYSEAVEQLHLLPAYSLHKKSIQTSMYVNYTFKTTDSLAYDFIDACYHYLGIENMHLLFKDNEIKIALKAHNGFLNSCKLNIDHLNTHCENAVIELFNTELQFVLFDKPLTVILKGDAYHTLKDYAEEKRMSFSEIINELIEKQLR